MAYVDIATLQTIATGQPLLAATVQQIRDDLEFLVDPPACGVYHSTSQTLTSGTWTAMSADTEEFDNDSMHSTVTNTSRITVQTAGRYLAVASILFAANTAADRGIRFAKNGTAVAGGIRMTSNQAGSQTTDLVFTRVLGPLAASDYITVEALQRSGGDLAATLLSFGLFFQTR